MTDWNKLQDARIPYFSPIGRSGKPIRLMVGIRILKHRHNRFEDTAADMRHGNARCKPSKEHQFDNEINRYNIGTVTEGLQFISDGSLDLYLFKALPWSIL